MDPLINLTLWTMMVGLAALCAVYYKSRAAPKLVLECASEGSGIPSVGDVLHLASVCEPVRCPTMCGTGEVVRCPPLSSGSGSGYGPPAHLTGGYAFEARNLARRFPATSEILGSSNRMGKRDRDRRGPSSHVTSSNGDQYGEDDIAGPQLASVKPPYRARARMYAGFVRALEAAVANPDHALAVKVELQSRHPGNRQLINHAFDEAITANVDNDVTKDFVSAFKEVGDKFSANLLRQSLKEELPAEAGLIDEAYCRVYAA